jgi:polyisoprenoid-binding protein YceI
MNRFLLLICIISFAAPASAQKYIIDKSNIEFYSHAAIEDIKADNKKASGIFDAETSELVFSIPINEFQFAKSLMQEHFNEKYMESDKYPKATFKGKVTGFDPQRSETQEASATGQLTIHGITREVTIPGSIDKVKDKLLFKTKFIVKLVDYKIEIPQLLWQNIAEQVAVTADFTFKPR